MTINEREILRGHAYLCTLAEKAFRKGDLDYANHYIHEYCVVGNSGNWIYHNPRIVDLIERMARIYYPEAIPSYQAEPKRVVFYDQYGISYVLALQYLRALANNGYEVLYLLSDYYTLDDPNSIMPEMEAHPHVHVHIVDNKLPLRDRMREIVDTTIAYRPSKIFMHVRDCSAFNFAVSVIPNCCDVYYINQHDHAFWIKNKRIDYCIPYRAWGATIDIEKRDFKPEQELLVPYYPIIVDHPFQGFPEQVKGKVILFSGGNMFKTYDDENTYWKMVIRILIENPTAVILYAIKGYVNKRQLAAVRELTSDETVLERLIPIGFRTDINEVFKHCDIFLGTCPMSGGLMSQYAAVNSKPILQYYPPRLAANNETEQVLDYNGKEPISFTDLDLFMQEAKHLINDAAYRKQRGEAIHKCLITQPQFDELLVRTIETNQNQVPYERTIIDYDAFTEWWLSMDRWGFTPYGVLLRSVIGKRKYLIMPILSIKAHISGLWKASKK